MNPSPCLDAETEVLIAQLVADSFDHFDRCESPDLTTYNPHLGPSQIGASYHDYEEPLSSYERQLLEGSEDSDGKGWTVSDTAVLSPTGTSFAKQPKVDLPSNSCWNQEEETSEEFKQDQIMAAQHKEVMEERISNGLRVLSPARSPGEGRIAAMAKDLHQLATKSSILTLSPLAATFVPSSVSPERTGDQGSSTCRWANASPGRERAGSSQHDHQSHVREFDRVTLPEPRISPSRRWKRGRSWEGYSRGRPTGGKRSLLPGGYKEQMYGFQGPYFRQCSEYLNPNDVNVQMDARHSNGAPSASESLVQESKRGFEHLDNRLRAQLNAVSSPDPRSLFTSINGEVSSQLTDMGSKDKARPYSANHEKGKGKERASSPNPRGDPTPACLEPPDNLSVPCSSRMKHKQRKTFNHSKRRAIDNKGHDFYTGEPIVYIGQPERDPEQERIEDSKVTEIHLGATEDDEPYIREVFGEMRMEDLDFEVTEAMQESAGERNWDMRMITGEPISTNERVVGGGTGVTMARW